MLRHGISRITLHVMKQLACIFILGLMHANASVLAQKVSLHYEKASLEKIFKDIGRQTGYSVIYDGKIIDHINVTSVQINNVPLADALTTCLQGTGLTFTINTADKIVTIKKAPAPVTEAAFTSSVITHDLTVHVTDSTGQPISGASVYVKGTKQGGSTDARGNVTLTGIGSDATLVISYIGYETREIPIDYNNSFITVILKPNDNPLDQVQIIAYGQTIQRLSTGDVTTINSSVIEKAPVENVLSAIEGRVPGLLITQSSGMPNSPYTVQIRGQNSIQNGNYPFYVIDGVPYTSILNAQSSLNPAGAGNPLDYINPSDIESISVLKDADATAIYGSRAANGAILITTKKGKAGKLKLDVNASDGMAKAPLTAQWLNTTQYLAMRHEAFKNDGVQPNVNNAPDLLVWDTTRYTNWQKLLIGGTASYTNVSADVSGGNNAIQYLFGATYNKQSTVFPSSNTDQKLGFHFNLNGSSENQKFKFTLTANYDVDNSKLPTYDLTALINTPPDAPPIYNSDGTLNWANSTFTNPMAYTLQRYNATTNNLVANALISYALLKGLIIKSSFGYTNLQSNESSSLPIASFDPAFLPTGSSSFSNNNIHSWIIEPQLSYVVSAGKSQFNALLGSTFEENISNGLAQDASGYSTDALLESIAAAPTVYTASLTNTIYKYSAVFGRLNYNYDDKYLADINWRRDGSSRFGPADEFHDFWSIGGAWIFTKEDFMKDLPKILSFGKLRASYGTTGNDQIADYAFYNLFTSSTYPYQGSTGLTPSGLYNPFLEWEETKKLEGGLELGFVNDRIVFSASYYYDRSSNQLLRSSLPSITGFPNITTNFPATVQNTGWEFSLSTINVSSKYFNWKSSFDFTANQNKLVSFPGLSTNASYKNSYAIGQPISSIKVFQAIGVNPQTGIYQFEASNGQPTYTPSSLTDRTDFVNLAPKFYGGFQNSFSYRQWQLDVFFQFKKQIGQNPLFYTLSPPGNSGQNYFTGVLDRWQAAGDKATYEQFTQTFGGSVFQAYGTYEKRSNLGYKDASYLRLSNLSLSYQLSGEWMKRINLQRFQIFIHAQNLLTITGYKGLDPETLNNQVLPILRVITAGVQLSL